MAHLSSKAALFFLLCCISVRATSQTKNEDVNRYIAEADKAENDEGYRAIMKSADSFANKTNDAASRAKVAEYMGHHYFNSDADESIKYLQKANVMYTALGNKKEATACIQNIAFAYENKKKDYAEAMKYTKRSITAQAELKDTLRLANMYKYQSMLYGKMHDFKEGKKSGAKAIALYKAKDFKPGLGVAYCDLAVVYEEEREYDSAIQLMDSAVHMWHEGKDGNTWRLYSFQNALIRLYTKAGRMDEAEALIQKNEGTSIEDRFYQIRLAFLKETNTFYNKKKDKENARIYKEKYSSLRDSLKEAGQNFE